MIRSRPTLLFAAVSLLAFACDGGGATSPSGMPPSPNASTASSPAAHSSETYRWANGTPSLARCAPRGRMNVSKAIGPAGGTLAIGKSSLTIPAGALAARVTITAMVTGDSSSTIHFGPEGLRFRRPADLVINSAGCNIPPASAPAVVYLGAAGDVRETIPAIVDTHLARVAAPIQHFSGYAIAF